MRKCKQKGMSTMSIHKDKKSNTWYVKYKNKTKRGFKTRKQAEQYEAKLKLSIISNADCDNVYFSDIAEDLKKYMYQRYQGKNISYGTYAKYELVIDGVIKEYVENKRINRITEMDCRNFSEKIAQTGYSTVHKNYILNVYKAVFKHGIRFFGLTHNPSIVIEPLKKTFDEKMRKKDKERNVWTESEFSRFIQCVHNNIYRQFYMILYYTGMRVGEALALQWSDFDGKCLHINKSLSKLTEKGIYEIKETKNVSSVRTIDLGHTLASYLIHFKNEENKQCGFQEDWFIFGRTKPLPRTSIDRIKDHAIEEAHLKRIRIHDFRHSHASNLIANGINIVAVSKRLGHSDVNMTLSVYTHLIEKNAQELTNYIEHSSSNLLKNTISG